MTESQKKEAILRMTMLHLHPGIIERFEKTGEILAADDIAPFRSLFENEKKDIKKYLEDIPGGVPYFVIPNSNNRYLGDDITCILQISRFESDWEIERAALERHNSVAAYVCNHTYPEYSEPGMIQVQLFGTSLYAV